ncbi:MAG: phosphoglycerate dehydrogenase, partial [Phascolarctobacterium sp.]|nr:phosphoglycerate dehydrogenase [Candidatus Phascolarctobacterium equi]
MFKVLVAEDISEKGVELLQKSPDLQVDVKMGIPREELLQIIGDYDAIVVRSVTKVNEELYARATNLKVVGRAGNGVDNIEMAGASKRGIIVVNTPESNVVSAAEHTIGLLLSSSRNIVPANKILESGKWARKELTGSEMLNKTLGIIGLGRIGALVTKRMQAFGMKIIAYDPYIADSRFEMLGVEKCATLEELLRRSDVITIHTPKTEETVNIINDKEFALCKKGVRIVNCARGGLINEDALVRAIHAGIVASAGVDVLMGEPKPVSPLIAEPKVVVTPHLGAETVEAQTNVGIAVAEEVISALRGEMVPNAVNLPALHSEELADMMDYLQLGEALGKLYFQLEKAPVEKVGIIYHGSVAQMETSLITRAVLKGVFEPVMRERVNYVNAQVTAEARGVAITVGTTKGQYNEITVNVTSKEKTFKACGTVIRKGEVR